MKGAVRRTFLCSIPFEKGSAYFQWLENYA
jgi:hypothetical protein